MKRPTEVVIKGNPYKITYNTKDEDYDYSEFNIEKRKIRVRHSSSGRWVEDHLVHELIETALVEHGLRYYNRGDNSGFVFVFNHKEFDLLAEEIANIVRQL